MIRLSKRMQEAKKQIEKGTLLSVEEAIDIIGKFPAARFDETIELHLHLNIDPKKAEQMVRGTVVLPHGTGKKITLAVFCKGEKIKEAEKLGADYVGADDLIEKVQGGFLDFDRVIATPDIMRDLSKLGRVLGPRGLMPTPKAGTVTNDIEKAIKEIKAGKIEFKSDKQGGIHVVIGKRSFSKEKLVENARHLLGAVRNARPSVIKGVYLKTIYLAPTMGPSIKVSL